MRLPIIARYSYKINTFLEKIRKIFFCPSFLWRIPKEISCQVPFFTIKKLLCTIFVKMK